ncbi:hypothetical protein, partial [Polymorphospora rubra]
MASIEQRGDSWRVVWRYNGDKQYTTWPAKSYAEQAKDLAEAHRHKIDADKVYREILEEADTVSDSTAMTFREWCQKWLPAKTRITERVRADYRAQLINHIYPPLGDAKVGLGDTPIDQITGLDIGAWVNAQRASGAHNKTITRRYSLLHSALEAAVRQEVIRSNPCGQTDFVRDQVAEDDVDQHEPVYLTHEEFALLRAGFDA